MGRLWPLRRILGQQAVDEGGERRRNVGPALGQRRGGLGDMRGDELLGCADRKRVRPGEQLVGDDAERVQVGPVVRGRVAERLLGRHVRGGAHRDAQRRERASVRRPAALRGRVERLGDAEIRDEGVPLGKEDVLRLQVAVHHALAVRVRERVGELAHEPERVAHRERAALAEERPQRLARDKGHRVVRQPVDVARAEQREDVRVLKPGGERDFALEPRRREARGQVGMEHLDYDASAELRVRGHEDAAHGPAAELALDAVCRA